MTVAPCFDGTLLTMPLLVLNMGCEMIYILNQRLVAQSVPSEKSTKVLADVARALFAPEFVEGVLFKPQEPYTMADTRQVLKMLAHSSIMCLNDNSMDKLYDLVTMGYKYQVVQVNQPHQLLHVLINHLESIRRILAGCDTRADALVASAMTRCLITYGALDYGEWFLLRQRLLGFFEGKKTKVSLFLQHSVQRNDGYIILNPRGNLPRGGQIPGTVTFYEGGSVVTAKLVRMPLADRCLPPLRTFLDAACPLGLNFYDKDKCALLPGIEGFDSDATKEAELLLRQCAAEHSRRSPAPSRPYGSTHAEGKSDDGSGSNAVVGLNVLASLIGAATPGEKGGDGGRSHGKFKINLFPEDAFGAPGKDENGVQTITIDLKEGRETAFKLVEDWSDDEGGCSAEAGAAGAQHKRRGCAAEDKGAGGDDLLELMDSLK